MIPIFTKNTQYFIGNTEPITGITISIPYANLSMVVSYVTWYYNAKIMIPKFIFT